MYPPKFDYYRANSVDDAISLLEEHGFEAKLLAGGHSLIPMMKLRLAQPGVLIDIGRIEELRQAPVDRAGRPMALGPLLTHTEVESIMQGNALGDAASVVGDVQVRNKGTIGGNLAHADPASDIPAAFLALNGTVNVRGPDGDRSIAADDFFLGLFMTALGDNEIITSLTIPRADASASAGSAYVDYPNPASGYAIVGVAANVELQGDTVESIRVAANGVLDHATRLTAVEDALRGNPATDENIEAAAQSAGDSLNTDDVLSDLAASADYRVHLLQVYTEKALTRAVARARS